MTLGNQRQQQSDGNYHDESSPLLLPASETPTTDDSSDKASDLATTLNLIKTCMGTGCLALPYAAKAGGIVIFVTGICTVAAWNVHATHLLLQAGKWAQQTVASSSTTTTTTTTRTSTIRTQQHEELTMARVAHVAYGNIGVRIVDTLMVVLLLGIVVAFLCAILQFTALWPAWQAGVVVTVIITVLSTVPHVGWLSHSSAAGLFCLVVTFVLIIVALVDEQAALVVTSAPPMINATIVESSSSSSWDSTDVLRHQSLQFWPRASFAALSHWFGVVVFGFGTVPLTFHFANSMQHPDRLVRPVLIRALAGTAVVYCAVGVGLYIMCATTLHGDILSSALPLYSKAGIIATMSNYERIMAVVARTTMSIVILLTAPLLVVPLGELLEKQLWGGDIPETQQQQQHDGATTTTAPVSTGCRFVMRAGLTGGAVLLAIVWPSFVHVVSLVGSTFVAAVSFVVPPVLHRKLLLLMSEESTLTLDASAKDGELNIQKELFWDSCLIVLGIAIVAVTTVYNIDALVQQGP